MTERKLASMIAKLEGKRSQAKIGEIREVIRILQDLIKEETLAYDDTNAAPVLKCLCKKASRALEKRK